MFVPKTVRRWISVFRGDVAPALVFLSALLGIWFGLTPGLYGIHVALLIVALVVNIHFGIFLLSVGLGKSLCLAAAPLLYHVGVWTHNQLGGVLDLLTEIPIIGITDVSRYAVAGSLVLGPFVGLVAGLLLARSVQRFRRTWLRLEEGSEEFKRWMNKGWIKLLARAFVGKGVSSAADVLNKRPKYVRVSGVILAVVVVGGAVAGASMIKGDLLIDYAERSLTGANGAQVDIGELELGMLAGRVSVGRIGVTDPERPTHNRIEIAKLTADISLWELLRGRLVMEEVAISGVVFETTRDRAGEVVRSEGQAVVSEEESRSLLEGVPLDLGDVATAESYFANGEQVREYLRKLQEWLPSGEEAEVDEARATVPAAYLEYLDAVAPKSPTPRLVIRKLVIDDVIIPVDGLGNSRLVCFNLSDAPAGMSEPVVIEVASKETNSFLKLTSSYGRGGGSTTLDASFEGIDLAGLQKNLKRGNPVVLQGGRASAKINGSMTREVMDIAFAISVTGFKANVSGGIGGLDPQITSEAMKVLDTFELSMRLVGPTTSPRLVLDAGAMGQSMRDALVKAGKNELARRAGALLEGKLPEGVPDLVGGKNPLKALFGDKSSDDAAATTKTQDKGGEARNEIQKALGGLFGKKKKKDKGGG